MVTALAWIVAGYALGFGVSAALWQATRGVFEGYVFQRRNYRDHALPTSVGVLVPVAAAAVVAAVTLLGPSSWEARWMGGPAVVAFAVSFALLGFLDDMGGAGQHGGFRGHLRAAAQGRVTTGLLKMVGGPLVSLALLASPGAGWTYLLRSAAIVCLAANLANLLDRAPGRTGKVAQLAFLALVLTVREAVLAPVAAVAGAAAALLGRDLREVFMLGDAGANALGAVLGVGVVITTEGAAAWVVLGVLAALNVASELVSFTKVIDAVGPLRRLDRLGAPHRPR